jgi:hypothetical protein
VGVVCSECCWNYEQLLLQPSQHAPACSFVPAFSLPLWPYLQLVQVPAALHMTFVLLPLLLPPLLCVVSCCAAAS